jgi:hypothetical protein
VALAVIEFQAFLTGLANELGVRIERLAGQVSNRMTQPELLAFVTDAYPALATPYLSASADATAVWYEEQPAPVKAAEFVAQPADLTPVDQLAANARWAMLQRDPVVALQGSSTRAVFDSSRNTVFDNAAREDVRWARHAAPTACGFCRLLATRGAVYRSQSRALRAHDHCHCLAVPDRDGRYEPPDYVQQWEKDYEAALDDGARTPAEIAYAMDKGRAAAPAPKTTSTGPADPGRPADDPLPQLPVKQQVATIGADAEASNPNFAEDPRYQDNCTHCVNAYELRRRGYDVEATKAPKAGGRYYNTEILNRWVDDEGRARYMTNAAKTKKVLDGVVEQWGDGSRGWVTMVHKGGGGHIFVVENVGGEVRYIDPQDPSVDAAELLLTKKRKAGTQLGYVRVDDLTPTDKVLDPADPLVIPSAEAQAARKVEAERKAAEQAARAAALPAVPARLMAEAAEAAGYGLKSGALGDFAQGVQDARMLTAAEALQKRSTMPFTRSQAVRAGYEFYKKWMAAQ